MGKETCVITQALFDKAVKPADGCSSTRETNDRIYQMNDSTSNYSCALVYCC